MCFYSDLQYRLIEFCTLLCFCWELLNRLWRLIEKVSIAQLQSKVRGGCYNCADDLDWILDHDGCHSPAILEKLRFIWADPCRMVSAVRWLRQVLPNQTGRRRNTGSRVYQSGLPIAGLRYRALFKLCWPPAVCARLYSADPWKAAENLLAAGKLRLPPAEWRQKFACMALFKHRQPWQHYSSEKIYRRALHQRKRGGWRWNWRLYRALGALSMHCGLKVSIMLFSSWLGMHLQCRPQHYLKWALRWFKYSKNSSSEMTWKPCSCSKAAVMPEPAIFLLLKLPS